MGFMTIKMNWTKARKVSCIETGTQCHYYHYCYCVVIITIIKMRRIKLAIQMKWHEVLGASVPILQAVPLSF